MFDFIQKLIYSFLAIQEKFLRKNLGRNFKQSYSNATSKTVFSDAASLSINSQTEKNKIKLENNVKCILKKYENNPQKLLDFVQRSGTNVYKIPFADKLLKIIGLEEGFIVAAKGFSGLYLNFITSVFSGKTINLSPKTNAMFIIRDLPLDNYCIIQQFYKWYAMKLNLPGFDVEAQNNFQKFLEPSNDSKIGELSIEEILGLKEAIARDVEAINFVVNLAKSTAGSKNALKKLTAGGASI
jgi:hypothetical protein